MDSKGLITKIHQDMTKQIESNTPETQQQPLLAIHGVRQRLFPIHMLHVGGYFEPDVNTYCQLGDGYDRGFYQGTQDWDKVTCKRCLKHKPNS